MRLTKIGYGTGRLPIVFFTGRIRPCGRHLDRIPTGEDKKGKDTEDWRTNKGAPQRYRTLSFAPLRPPRRKTWRASSGEGETTWKDDMTAARTIMLQVIPPFLLTPAAHRQDLAAPQHVILRFMFSFYLSYPFFLFVSFFSPRGCILTVFHFSLCI